MSKEIGKFLGEVVDIDVGASRDCLGKYLRVRVVISISKPLKRFLQVDLTGSRKETILVLKYEKLTDHCHAYGMLGHMFRSRQSKVQT
ncbi:hypothetical protein Dsin_006962 [Dipteronia sinensis]|uniref:Uncharacterized protein n=1 Tax=Dipteronia sinensis TaxID=43782 RepID=A0AAE0B0K3_9ROSI|nr:hypothetical protein Dsin_006962 [Dipteronia sinensis]